jgi:uncharacterized protein (TIGR02452 family)
MANPYHSGGSYLRGASAQEEDIFRRTNASDLLDHARGKQSRQLYPIANGEVIYCPTVQAFRHSSAGSYAFFDEGPIAFSMITSAAGTHSMAKTAYSWFTE